MTQPGAPADPEELALVRKIAGDVRRRFRLEVGLDELVSYGFLGLAEARERFDPERGARFTTFAYYRVRGAILDGVAAMSRLPRGVQRAIERAASLDETMEASFHAQLDRGEPTRREDAAATFDELLGEVTAEMLIEAAGSDAARTPEDRLFTELDGARVRRALGTLPERDRAIVRAIYFEERTLDDIAGEHGMTKSAICKIHHAALRALREHFA